jgi:hypothetical protein
MESARNSKKGSLAKPGKALKNKNKSNLRTRPRRGIFLNFLPEPQARLVWFDLWLITANGVLLSASSPAACTPSSNGKAIPAACFFELAASQGVGAVPSQPVRLY